jgi:hypothetical protein
MEADTEATPAAATDQAALDSLKSSAREVVDKASLEQQDADNNHSVMNGGGGSENGDAAVAVNGNGDSGGHESEEEEEKVAKNGEHSGEDSQKQNGAADHESEVKDDLKTEEEVKDEKDESLVAIDTDVQENDRSLVDNKARIFFRTIDAGVWPLVGHSFCTGAGTGIALNR